MNMRSATLFSVVLSLLMTSGCASDGQRLAWLRDGTPVMVKPNDLFKANADRQYVKRKDGTVSEVLFFDPNPPTKHLILDSAVLFEFNSAQLKKGAQKELLKAAVIIANNKDAKSIYIEGYTDTFGSLGYNKTLALARATSVANWLKYVTGASNLVPVGMGPVNLVVAEGTPDQQAPNRRVEIKVIK